MLDPLAFLTCVKPLLTELVQAMLLEWNALKAFMSLEVKFVRPNAEENDAITPHLNSTQREILDENDVTDELHQGFQQILLNIDNLVARGSGWIVDEIISLHVHFAKYKVLHGGTTFAKLPKALQAKGAIINVINDDDRCFMWSVLASKHSVSAHAERITHYQQYMQELDFSSITFPMKLKDINKFEQRNDISVNVFGLKENKVLPYRISKLQCSHHTNLMLYQGHYSWIKNLDRLLSDQRKSRGKKYFCQRCLLPQYKQEILDQHIRLCQNNQPTRVQMPQDTTLKFRNYHRAQRTAYVIYADFESLLIPIENDPTNASNVNTVRTHLHTPCGFGYVELFQCCEESPNIGAPVIHRGPDCATCFLEKITGLADAHAAKIDKQAAINMTTQDWERHNSATFCSICDEFLSPFDRVRDHCHFCSKFRGTAHSQCNLAYRNRRVIPVLFHNLKKYDAHILMKALGPICNEKGLEISCIARTIEEYISFSITKRVSASNGKTGKQLLWTLRFTDSYLFLTSSLQSLVNNLRSSNADAFNAIRASYPSSQIDMLLRKGVYPYEFMNSWDRFNEQQLPDKECFYSNLTQEDISEDDYVHAIKVWEKFGITNLGQYHDLYLQTDVLLLCDVFESFRSFCLRHYRLDPAHYLTLPSFGFDACLKMTKVELELLTDSNMYSLFENGIKGGISVVSHRFAKANNPYLPNHNAQIPSSYILYIDMNNLYGTAMVDKLPLNNFRWLSEEEINAIDWFVVDVSGYKGYILEVDLIYPAELHNEHADYPLAPEKLVVTGDMLSPYCQECQVSSFETNHEMAKLIPNLRDKTNYILHFQSLQLYLKLGLRLKAIHRVISFNQSSWMATYVEFNTSMRQKATNSFDRDLFKLLNNAVYGKTMENVREYQDVKLVTTSGQFSKLAANPRYKYSSVFTPDLVGVSMHRKSVQLCKPMFVGFTILELSKVLMFSFHYDTIKKRYGHNAKLCLTDTDSFIYTINTPDVYADIAEMHKSFDTSNYPPDHFLFSDRNKKTLGKMKDELGGEPPSEFVGLRSKMYSLQSEKNSKTRAKGVQRAVVKAKYRHHTYRDILFNRKHRKDQMYSIRSHQHALYNVSYAKVSLSPFDDKRYILNDGVTSLPYFHADIMNCSD